MTIDGLEIRSKELNDFLMLIDSKNNKENMFLFDNPFPASVPFWHDTMLQNYYEALTIWKSGNHTESRYPPKYFIDWAFSKGIKPKWLDWAKENGLIDNDNKPEIEDKEPTGKSRTSFQNAMAALFNELLAAKQEKNPKITKSAIIQKLMDKYSGVGIKESFLTKNINEGQKTLQQKQ